MSVSFLKGKIFLFFFLLSDGSTESHRSGHRSEFTAQISAPRVHRIQTPDSYI